MTSSELREQFLRFFEKHGHTVVPSSSLIPDDPSVLLTTAGMQQFKPYFIATADPLKDFGSLNTTSVQKSFRTSDIDEVGDERHLTFFEMLGNFSFGGYFKREAIQYAYDFLKEVGLEIEYVTVFAGDVAVLKDEESKKIWEELGVKDIREEGKGDNFWGPTGKEGPCGPTTEIYAEGIELWNIVFNEYYCRSDGKLEKLKTPGIDTGMGLERLAMVSQGKKNIFETDLFAPLIALLPIETPMKIKRVLADHLRASIFLVTDGVRPSNKEVGYILRRLLRRILAYQSMYDIHADLFVEALQVIKKKFGDCYPEMKESQILEVMKAEQDKYEKVIALGVSVIHRIIWDTSEELGRKLANLYQELGVNFELAIELLKNKGSKIDKATEAEVRKSFDERFKEHQKISRAGAEKKFGGHGLLLDTGELKAANEEELKIVTRLHTATHLLQAGLRNILGESVHQAGSDITAERLRFDFTLDRKLTLQEIKQVENWVNLIAQKDVPMEYQEMPYEEAIKTGALYFEKETYPSMVKVYSAADPNTGEVFSKELCGGPHVTHTGEVGHFKILKEESVGAQVRRIRATILAK